MKKSPLVGRLVVIVVAALAAAILGASFLSRKAPGYLRRSLEKALQKKVRIRDIQYDLPMRFELRGVEVLEEAPFQGEASFEAEEIRLRLSPVSLSRKALVIDALEVEGATVSVRKLNGKLTHPFSAAVAPAAEGKTTASATAGPPAKIVAGPLPLEIHKLKIDKSLFKLIDYDVEAAGFVVAADRIRLEAERIRLPSPPATGASAGRRGPTRYRLEGLLLQGREERPARLVINGWTDFGLLDTDALLAAKGVRLPYFRPYYGLVTGAVIREGTADLRAVFRIERKEFVGNIDVEIVGLLFDAYEEGDLLFGLKAGEILSFLKDSSGHLRLTADFRRDLADRSVKPRELIRRSIAKSLKETLIGNIGRIVQGAAHRIGEENPEKEKNPVEETVKKIKDFLKY
ncbi:MAG: AsmA family protein [Candidatus Omnitrophica bacterium]|nr:AsmA family protein [Candidatus Omnitrophota bacterium]